MTCLRWLTPISIATLSLAVAGCAGSENGAQGTTPNSAVRDTELVHEACDGESQSAKRIDVNGDGRPDIIHVMDGQRETCRIVDLNLDGAVDAYIYYDAQGQERRRESDFDRDGRADEVAMFEGGTIVRKERETNYDSKLDTWDFYDGGRLARRERDSDGDGIIDQWWEFNNAQDEKCAVVASDRDADGKPDPDSVVDLCGEGYKAPEPEPPPPSAPPADLSPPTDDGPAADKPAADKPADKKPNEPADKKPGAAPSANSPTPSTATAPKPSDPKPPATPAKPPAGDQ